MTKLVYYLLIFTFVFAGCTPDAQPRKSVSYDDLPADAVLLRVDGRALTKAAFEESVALRMALIRLRKPKLDGNSDAGFRKRILPKLMKQFLPKYLYLNEVERLSLKASAQDRDDAESPLVLGYGPAKMKKFSDFAKLLSASHLETLENLVTEDARIIAYWRSRAPEAFVVTPDEFNQVTNRFLHLQARSNELIAKQRALAKEVYKKLVDGCAFEDVAYQYSSVTKEDELGYIWGAYLPKDIPYDEMIAKVAPLQVGQFTEPMELEDGIHIVKRLPNTGSIGEGRIATVPDEYVLGRIVLALPKTYELATEQQIRRDMRKKKLEPLQRKWLDELMEKAQIDYPSGTNLWKTAKKSKKVNPKQEGKEL